MEKNHNIDILKGAPLFYPEAREWMWDYCVYLGPYTNKSGENFDLGVYMGEKDMISLAVVYGPHDGNYISGMLQCIDVTSEVYAEVLKRAIAIGLMDTNGKRRTY
jgi:hypothetical protein